MSYLRADVLLSFFHTEIRSRNTRAAFFRKEKDAFGRLIFSDGIPSRSFRFYL